MIEIEDLSFQYGSETPVFSHLHWKVEKGETWAVLGSSGCGKTTLLNLLAGLIKAQSGKITINGCDLNRPRPETGLILQNHGLMPWATVSKNIELGFRIRRFYGPDGKHTPRSYKKDKKQERKLVHEMTEKTGIAPLANRFPHQLSGGQQQRTAIARTLVLKPDLLLLDEPFSSLDNATRENLIDLVKKLDRENLYSRILVTHSIETAMAMGEKLLILRGPAKEPVILSGTEKRKGRILEYLGEDYE